MPGLPKETMDVRVLEDGTVRVETGNMGAGVAHKGADDFLKELARLLGGEEEVTKLKHAHGHHHDHAHEHGEDHTHQ